MQRWLMLLGCLLVTHAGVAQTSLSGGKALVGHFQQQRYLAGFDFAINSSGRFRVNAEAGLVWHTLLPFESRLEIAEGAMTQQVGGELVAQHSLKRMPAIGLLGELLQLSFSQNWQQLEHQFGIQPQFNGESWRFEMTTVQLSKNFGLTLPLKKIVMEGGQFVNKVTLQRAEGDYDVITFSQQTRLPANTAEVGQAPVLHQQP